MEILKSTKDKISVTYIRVSKLTTGFSSAQQMQKKKNQCNFILKKLRGSNSQSKILYSANLLFKSKHEEKAFSNT